jgi:hypothetical protein
MAVVSVAVIYVLPGAATGERAPALPRLGWPPRRAAAAAAAGGRLCESS